MEKGKKNKGIWQTIIHDRERGGNREYATFIEYKVGRGVSRGSGDQWQKGPGAPMMIIQTNFLLGKQK